MGSTANSKNNVKNLELNEGHSENMNPTGTYITLAHLALYLCVC